MVNFLQQLVARWRSRPKLDQGYRSLFEQAPISIWEEDWSALKPAVDALREKGVADFDAYFSANPDLVLELDSLAEVVNVNSTTLTMYEAPSKEKFFEFELEDIEAANDPEAMAKSLAALARGEVRFTLEGTETTYTGKQIFTRDTVFVPEGYRESWTRIMRVTEDISERKAAEAALQQSREQLRAANAEISLANSELEERVEQRTQEFRIAVQTAEAAMEVAEAANRAKSEFLANMSHEIRTPINGVMGMTELIIGTDLNPKQQRYAETIKRSSESLLGVINDVLDFSKIEAGKLALDESVFDLRNLLEDLGELFAERAHRKGIELLFAIPVNMRGTYRGDPGRLRQVLTNLIGNAIKFTESGEVLVRVRTVNEANDHDTLRFEVIDTGIGIPEAVREHIFEAFSQADSSTTRRFGGTGLGLAISRQLTELMGGEIGVGSNADGGSTFWFTVQLSRRDTQQSYEEADHQALRSVRALIVDDNSTNREIVCAQLSSWNIRHHDVPSGEQGLEALRAALATKDPFGLVILDKHMPDMNGLQLAREIRSDPSIDDVRIVMLSSAAPDPTSTINHYGIGAHLTKPVRQSELYESLLALFSTGAKPAPIEPVTSPEHNLTGHVLVAEDNLVNQQVTITMLEIIGCTVSLADNGAKVLEMAKACNPDLILMDCQMPVMDGFQATRTIRDAEQQNPALARVPIIALTANAMKGDRERCMAAGMDDYLSKPFAQDDLAAMLNKWMQPSPGPISKVSLDEDALANIRSLQRPDQPDVLERFLDTFQETSSRLLRELRVAVESKDPDQLKSVAHSLKSSSAILGATQMASTCLRLESLDLIGELETAEQLVGELETAFPMVCTALRTKCGQAAA